MLSSFPGRIFDASSISIHTIQLEGPSASITEHLQKTDLATDLVSTQPSRPPNKVQVASKLTPTKKLKNSRFDSAESKLSSGNNPSTATPNIQTNASLDDRKPAFQTTSGDSNTNQHVEGDASDYNNQEDVLEAVEDTDIVYVADDNNDNNVGDSVQDYDNTEAVEGVEDTEVVSIVVDDHAEPFDNESFCDDGPGSAMGDYQQDHLINTRLPKPSMKYETIPIYNFSPLQALRQQAYLLFERLFPNSSLGRTDTIRPLNVPSTELVDGFLREDFGSLYINGLKKRSHYEIPVAEFEVYQSEALRRSIKLRIHQGHPSPTILGDDSYQFILHNGVEHKEMINTIGFEELADDLLFTSPGSVPILNSRLNRGVTIGFTPSHCTARNPSSGGIVEPLLILGSMRYAFLFVLMTRLAKSQAQQAGFVAQIF